MMVSFADAIRRRVYGYLAAAGAELTRTGIEPLRASWLVSGIELDGVRVSFSDADDVIEFGVLSRVNGVPTNVLNVSISLDDEEAKIYCLSEERGDMNFQGPVSAEQASDGLFIACDYFAEVTGLAARV